MFFASRIRLIEDSLSVDGIRLRSLDTIFAIITLSFGITLLFFLIFHMVVLYDSESYKVSAIIQVLVSAAKTTIELAELQGMQSPVQIF